MPKESEYVISKSVPHPPLKLSQDEMARWNEDYHGHREHSQSEPEDIKEAEENLIKAMSEKQTEEFNVLYVDEKDID